MTRDLLGVPRDVRFVPKADIRRLFDHLVGEQQYRWHFEAKLLRDLEIDGQQELGWAQDREVFRWRPRVYSRCRKTRAGEHCGYADGQIKQIPAPKYPA